MHPNSFRAFVTLVCMLVGQSGWYSALAQQKINAQKPARIGKPLAVHSVRDYASQEFKTIGLLWD